MHGRRLATLLPTLALALLASAGGTAAAAAPASPSGEEQALLKAMNAARSAHGLPALRSADTLVRPPAPTAPRSFGSDASSTRGPTARRSGSASSPPATRRTGPWRRTWR